VDKGRPAVSDGLIGPVAGDGQRRTVSRRTVTGGDGVRVRMERDGDRMIATQSGTLAVPLAGAAAASVHLDFGGGELALVAAPAGMLVAGEAAGAIVETSGPGRLRIHPAAPTRDWRPLHWRLELTGEVPLDLALALGGQRSGIDLSALQVRRLRLDTGASETRVRLPSRGPTSVHVACGFALVTLEVPMDVPARIRGRLFLGTTEVDERRFPRAADGWASPDAGEDGNVIDILLEGAFGTVRVV
jgi:hypothetical protein